MVERIPYIDSKKNSRGCLRGSKNSPGHKAGRPSNGKSKHNLSDKPIVEPIVTAATKSSRPIKEKGPPQSLNLNTTSETKPVRIPYKECADGHNCPAVLDLTLPSNGNGKPKPTNSMNPLIAKSVIQSRMNEELITPEQIIKEVMKVALSDIADWPDCPETLRNAPEKFRKAVSSLSLTPIVFEGKPVLGPDGKVLTRLSFNLWSKNAAHDQLNKWAGNYSRDNAQSKPELNLQQNIQINQIAQEKLKIFSKKELLVLYKLGVLKSQENEDTIKILGD